MVLKGLCITLALLCLVTFAVVPVSAVVQEVTFRGTVVSENTTANEITINAAYTYGCDFSNSTPVCSWSASKAGNLSGTVPDPAVFSFLKPGDPVVATSMGGEGGTWIAVAKVFPTPGIEHWLATDLAGDPAALPVDLASDYSFDYNTTADCRDCTGAVCNATSAAVTLSSTGKPVMEKVLKPGESTMYNGRNDNSSVTILFSHGQAAATSCPGKAGIVGLQPVSDFVIHVNQAIAAPATTPVPAATVVTTRPAASSQPPAPATTKAPLSPAIVVSALVFAGLFMITRKS